LAANTSPEPFSNIALRLFEDVVAVGASLLMVFHPLVILGAVAVFLVFTVWLARRIGRALGRLFHRGGRACHARSS
jgi:NADH:ubiquinone oxidoreductase subunit 6 (subunit J)